MNGVQVIAGVGGATLASAIVGELAALRALRRDPEYRLLQSLPEGRASDVTSADGTRIHAISFGPDDPAVPTFVLAPGWTEELEVFSLVIKLLLYRGYRVVAYDLRGQGGSGMPQDGQEMDRYGEDVEAVLEATCAGCEHVILAGHSMGGMSIAAWAATHDVGCRIKAAALLSTGFSDLVATHRLFSHRIPAPIRHYLGRRYVLGGTAKPPPVSTKIGRAVMRRIAFAPSATDASIAFYEPMLRRCPKGPRVGAGRAAGRMDLLHAAEKLNVPTLVLVGAVDRLTPKVHSERIAEKLPELHKLVVLDGIGHMTPLECPDRVVDELVELAEQTRPAVVATSVISG